MYGDSFGRTFAVAQEANFLGLCCGHHICDFEYRVLVGARMHSESGRISIWFFIGLLVLVYGVLITGAGVYEIFVPPIHPVVLENLHAGLWWGILLLVLGGF